MKKYIEPKMNIILLQQSNQLLAGSTELDALNLEGLDLESLNM